MTPTEAVRVLREALAHALLICDTVPTNLGDSDDPQLATIGMLVNYQTDGTHGYGMIRDALDDTVDFEFDQQSVVGWINGVRDNILTPLSHEHSAYGVLAEGFGQESVAIMRNLT